MTSQSIKVCTIIGVLGFAFVFPVPAQGVSGKSKSKFIIEEKISLPEKALLGRNILTSLGKLKELETERKWRECSDLAPQVIKSYPDVSAWIFQSWTICLNKALSDQKVKRADAKKGIEYFRKEQMKLQNSVAWRGLRPELLRLIGSLIEDGLSANSKIDLAETSSLVEQYYSLSEEKEAKAQALHWSGDIALIQHQLPGALNLFEQSLQLVESKSLRDKILSVRLALDLKKEPPPESKELQYSEEELKFEERFKLGLKNSDPITVIDDAVSYLLKFPNGQKSKWAFDKIQEIYFNLIDKAGSGSDERVTFLRDRILNSFQHLEASRCWELAKNLHRRGDFIGASRLAEKVYSIFGNSPQGASILYVLGRSNQFLGQYQKARKYFETYLESHSAAEDFLEVQFRLGLVYFRMKQFSSSIAVFEKMLASKISDRYELVARYWLIRSLEQTSNSRSSQEAKSFVEKYPFTYYGLRLKAETQRGLLSPFALIVKGQEISDTIVWTSFQKKIWDRAILLARNSWFAEAYSEIAELSFGSNPKWKILLAKKLAENHLYSLAIKLLVNSVDQNTEFQVQDVLAVGFPEPYEDLIFPLARKNNLNPVLVLSLIRQESGFNERATSTSKAMGLMQLIPPTAAEVAQNLNLKNLELPQDAYVPNVNVQMGTNYLARMIKEFSGNVPMGLAAYNAGPARVNIFVRARPEVKELLDRHSSDPRDEIWIDELPWGETSFYVKAILRNTLLYRLKSGERLTLPPVLWSDMSLTQ